MLKVINKDVNPELVYDACELLDRRMYRDDDGFIFQWRGDVVGHAWLVDEDLDSKKGLTLSQNSAY